MYTDPDYEMTADDGADLDVPIPHTPTMPDAVHRLLLPTTLLLLRGYRDDLMRAVAGQDGPSALTAALGAADIIGRAIEALEGHL